MLPPEFNAPLQAVLLAVARQRSGISAPTRRRC